jgi:hypothetical protein
MENLSLRFIRWGAGLLVLGLLSGLGPLGHYLLMGTERQCSWAPIHGHVALLGWVGMTLFGLVYRALPTWASGEAPDLGLVRAHFFFSALGIVGVLTNGILGYLVIGHLTPAVFSERGGQNFWLATDGVFLALFGVGCVLFLLVLRRSTRYRAEAAPGNDES